MQVFDSIYANYFLNHPTHNMHNGV